jgi:hypothetical protein
MSIAVTIIQGGGTAAGTATLTDRVRADLGMQLGNRAYDGESSQATIVLDDDDGEIADDLNLPVGLTFVQIAAHNVVTVKETATDPDTVLFRGRVIPKDFGRGDISQDRSRQLTLHLDDYNADLKGLTLLSDQARGSETDVARVTWVFDTYLSGSPRLTTDLTSGIVAGDTVTMPAKTYETGTSILEILQDCKTASGKTFFVMPDGTFYYSTITDESQVAGLRISDRPDEITVGESSAVGASTVRLYPSLVDAGGASNAESLAAPNLGAADKDAAWDTPNNGGIVDYDMMYDSPLSTTTTSRNSWDGVNQAAGDFCVFGFEHRLDGDLLSIVQNGGAVRGQMNCRARFGIGISEASQEQYTTFCVRVYRPGTGFVATLVAVGDSVGTVKLRAASAGRNASFGPIDFTPFAGALDGDYLVIDVGNRHVGPLSGGTGAGAAITDSNASDLPLDDTSLDALNSWWQLGPPEESLPTYPPIWVGPASTEDGQELLSGGVLRHGEGVVTETRSAVADDYDYWVEPINDPRAAGTADASARLSAILDARQYEDRTYQVAIQLHNTEVNLVQAGQMIDIKARAIPDADDQFVTRRIASLEWQWIGPEHWLAVMELDRPAKTGRRTPGVTTAVKAVVDVQQESAERTSADAAHVAAGDPHPGYVLESLLDAKGDLISATADNTPAKLTVGANGTFLKADSAQPSGLTWDTPAGGSGLVIEEADGNPTGTATKLVLPNATLSYSGGTATYTPGAVPSGIIVQEVDGSPSGTATTLVLPNTTLSISGGTATYTPTAGGSGTIWKDGVPSGNAPAGTNDDEFADASLTGFTAQTVSGTATWTEAKDVLSVLFHSQTSGDWAAQLKALTTPSSPLVIETAVRIFSPHTSSGLVGLLLTDGTATTSNCIAATTIVTTSNNNIIAARGGTLTDLQNPVLDQHAQSFSMMIPWLYMRLTWSSANTFLAEWSPDGVTWSDHGLGTQSHTMTPTHMGVAVTNFGGGTTTPRIATFEYLRRS